MAEVEVGTLAEDDIPAAIGVCARAFRDSPSTIGCYGDDPLNRLVWTRNMFGGLLQMVRDPVPIVATYEGIVLGVCAFAWPGRCLRAFVDSMRAGPPPADTRPEAEGLRRWLFAMADHDLAERHVHVGPVAVDVGAQGMGIGSLMLTELCRGLDDRGDVAWLETDKPQNVRLYERFDFEVTGEVEVNGQMNWFMRRPSG